MAFKLLKEQYFPKKKMTVSVFEHETTKAKHYHTSYETEENSFSVAFRTLPENSKGVAHILEHSVLCGSEKFPAKNLFFNMAGRNFETFMNAMTGYETTQYPFSAIDKQGFFNLMEVYNDVVFFPKLEKETFLQEGWRYEIVEKNGIKELSYSGVVYNEMIGAYSNAARVSYVEMLKSIYKGSQYENFSGGHPYDITNLSYEEFIAFHKKYYHPSNAIFYTFGSIPFKEIHEKLENWVLSKFEYLDVDNTINMEYEKVNFALGEHPGEKGVTLNLGWNLPKFKNFEEYYEAQIICKLLSSGKNDINDQLLDYGTGDGFNILPINKPAIILSVETEMEKVDDIKITVNKFINNIITKGISKEEFENISDLIEMGQRREGEDGFGRKIISQYINLHKFDIDDVENINNVEINKNIRDKLANVEYFKNKIKEIFSENLDKFEYLSVANPLFSEGLLKSLKAKVNNEFVKMNHKDIEEIIKMNINLNERRNKIDNLDLLPKLQLNDIESPKEKNKLLEIEDINSLKVYSYKGDTNNLIKMDLLFPLNIESKDDLLKQYLVINLMGDLQFNGMSVEDSNFLRQTKTTAISGGYEIFSEDKMYWKFSLMSLSENWQYIVPKFKKILKEIDFSNLEKIKLNIISYSRDFLNAYQENAHIYGIYNSRSKINKRFIYDELLDLNYYTDLIAKLNNDKVFLTSVLMDLPNIYNNLFNQQPDIFIVSELEDYKNLKQTLDVFKGDKVEIKLLTNEINKKINEVIDFNLPTNHTSLTYKVSDVYSENGPVIKVFESIIKDYLIRNIRQKNGAYGAGVSYVHDGLLTFYSYRDSQIEKTINLITELPNVIDLLEINEKTLEISKLNIMKQLKSSKSISEQANLELSRTMRKNYLKLDIFAEKIKKVTIDNVKKFILEELKNPYISVISSENTYLNENGYIINKPLNNF